MSSKRGRKRNDNLPPNRARDVQRAFRARRAAHLSALEERVHELTEENDRLRAALNLPPSSRPILGRGPTGKDKPKSHNSNGRSDQPPPSASASSSSSPQSSTTGIPLRLDGHPGADPSNATAGAGAGGGPSTGGPAGHWDQGSTSSTSITPPVSQKHTGSPRSAPYYPPRSSLPSSIYPPQTMSYPPPPPQHGERSTPPDPYGSSSGYHGREATTNHHTGYTYSPYADHHHQQQQTPQHHHTSDVALPPPVGLSHRRSITDPHQHGLAGGAPPPPSSQSLRNLVYTNPQQGIRLPSPPTLLAGSPGQPPHHHHHSGLHSRTSGFGPGGINIT